jgi:hypothetical protein
MSLKEPSGSKIHFMSFQFRVILKCVVTGCRFAECGHFRLENVRENEDMNKSRTCPTDTSARILQSGCWAIVAFCPAMLSTEKEALRLRETVPC